MYARVQVRQTAYRITVHENNGHRNAEWGDNVPLFDSGRVLEPSLRHTTASTVKPYETLPLLSDRQYRWQLTVWGVVNGQVHTLILSPSHSPHSSKEPVSVSLCASVSLSVPVSAG